MAALIKIINNMRVLAFVSKLCFLAFFILNGWNQYADLKNSTVLFNKDYQNFEKSLHSKLGIRFPDVISWKAISVHAPFIVQAMALGQILFSVLALFGSAMSFVLVGLIFFIQQMIHLNIFNISPKTTMAEMEHYALALALMTATMAYSCHCSHDVVVVKRDDLSATDIEVDRRAKGKSKAD